MKKSELIKKLNIPPAKFNELIELGLPSVDDKQKTFDWDEVIKWKKTTNQEKIKKLVAGKIYKNEELVDTFACTSQGGMRRSHYTNSLVLITAEKKANIIYQDKWFGDTLHYTGMGQKGDQSFEYTQNKVLKNNDINKVNVYLFEYLTKNKYKYIGPVKLSKNIKPYIIKEMDIDGINRNVVKFPLEIQTENYIIEKDVINKEEKTPRQSEEDIKKKAFAASNLNKSIKGETASFRKVITRSYDRNKDINLYIKNLANGICQLCMKDAPFKQKNGEPFLHVHHVKYLSEGGTDTVDNCIALCPNCHAKIHELEDENDKNKLLHIIENRKVSD